MNNNVREDNLNLSYSTIISLLCSIVYLSGERTSFFLLILFFCLILFLKSFKKICIFDINFNFNFFTYISKISIK